MSTSAIIAALVALGFQGFWALQVVEAGERHGVAPEVIAGVILSEHNGSLKKHSSTVANKKSGCIGLGQIAPFWAKFYKIPVEWLRIPWWNIEVTARILARIKRRHQRRGHRRDHHWLAHYKCGTKGLSTCERPVRNALRYIDFVHGKLHPPELALR